MNVRNFISQENEQTTKRNINADEIHVKVTFKVKYKSKDSSLQTKKKKSQNKILEGYITEDNVALKRSDNIDKNLSDFMRNQPTYLKEKYFYYLQRNGKVIKQINKNLIVSAEKIENDDEIIVLDDLKIKEKLDKQIEKNEKESPILTLNSNRSKEGINDDFDIILKAFLKNRVEKSENIEIVFVKKKNNICKYIFLGFILLAILFVVILCLYLGEIDPGKQFIYEELIINVKYPAKSVSRYNYEKIIQIKSEGSAVSE